MIALALAAAAAVGWGASDFFGGRSSDETLVFSVIAITELLGAVVMTPILIAGGLPHFGPSLLLAGVAGLAVTMELSVIFYALSVGSAFITAPVGALGAVLACAAGVAGGDGVTVGVAVGLCCAILGGGITATGDPHDHGQLSIRQSIAMCLTAATGVAVTQITLHAAGAVNPYWATALEHASTAISAGALVAVTTARKRRTRGAADGPRLIPGRPQLPTLALVAFTGVGGDLAYAATAHAQLSTVSAIASLYPIPTIILASTLQHQRPHRRQAVGIILALTGVVILSIFKS